jgi:hypothetical protein
VRSAWGSIGRCGWLVGAVAGCGSPGAARDDAAPPHDAGRPDAVDASPFDGPPGTADLQFVASEMIDTVEVTRKEFFAGDCEVVEGCVGGLGWRRLLRFDTVTANRGSGDLHVGRPPPAEQSDDVFRWSACHKHHHVTDYTSYELVGATDAVISARKQSFCLQDVEQVQPGAFPTGYSCLDQGISVGWADVYNNDLPCQWIDVTDVPPGSYTLRVVVNPTRRLPESDHDNNVFTVEVPL